MTTRFTTDLAALCSAEITPAMNDPERGSEMITALCANLATTVLFTMRGDPKGMDEMLTGISNTLFEEAARQAPAASLLRKMRAS